MLNVQIARHENASFRDQRHVSFENNIESSDPAEKELIQLKQVSKEITVLPWKRAVANDGEKWVEDEQRTRVTTFDGNGTPKDHDYLVHAANGLPQLEKGSLNETASRCRAVFLPERPGRYG